MKIKFLTDLVVALVALSHAYTFVNAILLAVLEITSESDARSTICSNFYTFAKLVSSFATVNSLLENKLYITPISKLKVARLKQQLRRHHLSVEPVLTDKILF